MRDIRRLDIMWSGDEVKDYESLRDEAAESDEELPTFVKNVLRSHLEQQRHDRTERPSGR